MWACDEALDITGEDSAGRPTFIPFSGCFSTKFPSGTGKNYLPLAVLSVFFSLCKCPNKYKNHRNLNLKKKMEMEEEK